MCRLIRHKNTLLALIVLDLLMLVLLFVAEDNLTKTKYRLYAAKTSIHEVTSTEGIKYVETSWSKIVALFQQMMNIETVTGTVRADQCFDCFRHNFRSIINNENICKLKTDDDIVNIFIMIFTTADNREARDAIRETWLKHTAHNTAEIRYAFLLGTTRNQKITKSIQKEDHRYHDIIQEDFIDSYENLTYKTIMGFRWASRNCSNAKFIMKTDDDMWVNVPQLLNVTLTETAALQTGLVGFCKLLDFPIRNIGSKWYASRKSYPRNTYPGFCSGTGYVTSLRVATKIYHISKHIPFFHLEDVYVALCIQALGMTLKSIPGFHSGKPKITPCQYKGPNIITIHHTKPADMYIIWHADCSEN